MAKMTVLKVVCAWCGKFIRSVPGYGVSGISHGICKECAKVETKKLIDHMVKTQGISKDEAEKVQERHPFSLTIVAAREEKDSVKNSPSRP